MLLVYFVFLGLVTHSLGGGEVPSKCQSQEPKCGKHESYVVGSSACRKTCANWHVPDCGTCKPYTGCVCRKGYMRLNDDATGPCVRENKCQPKCGKHELYVVASSACPKTCANRHLLDCGTCKPYTGCVCRKGYMRLNDDATGPCVKENRCQPKCGKKEVYVVASSACRKTCANRHVPDSGTCKPYTGCVCRKGYIRLNDDATGPCIKKNKCPKNTCGVNEVYKKERTKCPPQTCKSLYIKYRCAPTDPEPGCDCIHDYLRNDNGTCIPKKKCPPLPQLPQCGKNEVSTTNRIVCPPQTCDSIYARYKCDPNREPEPGCDCVNGYLRDRNGVCILSEKCPGEPGPPQCGENEVSTANRIVCPPQTCESKYALYKCDPNREPEPGCDCVKGYLRDRNGVCILSEKCPGEPGPPQCGENEVSTTNRIVCPPQTCQSKYALYRCDPNREPEPGCDCVKGYLRDRNGVCILSEKCPGPQPVCGENEVATDDRIICPPQSCASLYALFLCANQEPRVPEPGCNCIDGYLRDSYGVCIPSEQCSGPQPICGENEVATNDRIIYPPQSCESIYTIYENTGVKPEPEPGCDCIDGYLRNSDGECIPSEECPIPQPLPVCGLNEEPTNDRIICPPQTCESIYSIYAVCEPHEPEPGCNCIDGYLRNYNGDCIPSEQCFQEPEEECGYNEVWSQNKVGCPPQTCESRYINYPCAYSPPRPGCVCIENHFRDENGICIPQELCPPPPTQPKGCNGDPNAASKECPNPCPPTCDNPKPSGVCNRLCLATGCECNKGYLLSKNMCVLPKDCPVKGCKGDPNATSKECINQCAPTCDNPNPSGVCNKMCVPGCECNSGYLRYNNTCVLPKNCPVKGCKGDPNATSKECINQCAPTCDNPNPSGVCNKMCVPGCECNSGYLRYNNTCVLPKDCPIKGCKGDPNATSKECINQCAPTCDNPNPSGVCNKMCVPGCECNSGYLRYNNTCVLPKDCPMKGCKGDPNATSKECINQCAPTCDNPNPSGVCNKLCVPGCECNSGYLRYNNTCVLPKNCPVKGCKGDPNATSKECINQCAPTCDNPNPSGVCNKMCVPGCECNSGYLRYNNTCVLPKDCPIKGCKGDPNATSKECINQCAPTCDNPNPSGVCNKMCVPGCECNSGYLRYNNTCVLPKDCPMKGCKGDPNATSKECINQCAPTCDNPNPSGVCNKLCVPGCECNSGYLRYNNTCVLPKNCPVKGCKGDPNATSKECINQCAPTCDNPNPSGVCNKMCVPGCECNSGYLRYNNTCVLPKDCPKPEEKCGYNEVWSLKKVGCPPQTCESQYIHYPCAYSPPQPGCVCIDNHYRNKSGICIPQEQCPPPPTQPKGCNGDPNATLKKCPNPCAPTCDNPNPSGVCNKLCLATGCECNPGYLRYNNTCVLPKDCPGGVKCPANEQFVNCKMDCPNNYCRVNDIRAILICDPARPCPSGCVCNGGYYRKSSKDKRCIKASECSPVNCTRPNEVFKSHMPVCLRDRCEDANQVSTSETCNRPNRDLRPQCVCRDGYYRNDSDICVPASECPAKGCNGDPNATLKKCPNPCAPTCDNPNPSGVCNKMCLATGCECNPGYLRYNNTCVLPKDCPGGVKCPANEQFVNCKIDCPNNYCRDNDIRAILICDPAYPCPSGCVCNGGYYRKSSNDRRCIKAPECPPVNCTRPNEVFKSDMPVCLRDRCEDANQEPTSETCNRPNHDLRPQCVCRDGYYRNDSDTCVPASECPFVCPISEKCRATCAVPNPKNCPAVTPAKTNVDGCQCQNGYILSEAGGKCIRIQDCPQNQGCNGDPNAVVRPCPRSCKSTCSKPNGQICYNNCTVGCECSYGFILSEENGRCIKLDDCSGGNPCGPNGTFVGCAIRCPNQYCPKDNRNLFYGCDPPYPCPSGCGCKSGYKRLNTEDRCVLSSDCPFVCPVDEKCRPTCANPSPNNCASRLPAKSNIDGCECEAGYILSDARGKCIRVEECPQNQTCGGDPHAAVRYHPWPCRATCGQVSTANCNKESVYYGCECEDGYILSKDNGKCIKVTECPGGDPCAPNATYSTFINSCPGQYCVRELERVRYPCDPVWPTPAGCVCKSDYLRLYDGDNRCVLSSDCPPVCPIYAECRPTCSNPNPGLYEFCPEVAPATTNVDGCQCQDGYILEFSGGKCVRIEECPQNQGCGGDSHAVVKHCPSSCPASCSNPDNRCVNKKCNPPGCVCVDGYIRSEENGNCILPGDCKGGDPCGVNATFSSCSYKCPENYCPKDDSNGPVCDAPYPCPPGCMCKPNHRRLSYEDDRCILASDCRPVNCTRENEVWSPCSSPCPGEYCPDPNEPQIVCNTLLLNCEPKCVCAKGYSRDRTTNLCIPTEECPNNNPCSSKCTPTCAEPNPPCDYPPAKSCCEDGYILSERNGLCIRIDECPRNISCNGDPHAIVKQCPPACPATCDHPETSPCKKACLAIGCDCAPGYIRSGPDGKCILATQCPGGDPCGPNGTFASCSFRCPNEFCPKIDSPFQIACSAPFNCPPGCNCKLNHKRLSNEDDRCILAPDCPPLECKTRPNEVWSSCPEACLRENCRDVNEPPSVCYTLVWNCNPRCICEDGYYRNGSEICIPAKQCPEYINPCESKCLPTCAEPNPPNCTDPIKACCADGNILSERGGRCIKIDECPKDIGCNGDPHAEVKTCPAACPSTCDHRDPTREGFCEKKCLAVGCECSSGYIRSTTDGKCILPDKCPGGDPCGPNGTHVDCGFRCPNQYCPQDDSGVKYACKPPRNCPPGCGCKLNYKRLSYEDDRCILATECPPLECKTRPNEVWSSCPSACLAEGCTNVNDPPSVCQTLVLNCDPNCICEQGYYRNSSDICVPAQECEGFNPCQSKCTPTCKQPNPPDCANPPTKKCCEDGYILSEWNGTCIKIEECPRGCSGDPNAVVKQCPDPCPSTCQAPNAIPCRRACLAVGCQCAPGYLRSEPDGLCIKPNECSGGNPCGQNEVFVPCKTSNPTDFCPVDDSRAVIADSSPCLSGCVCRVNHKRKSINDQRCIISSDCPPVKCRRPNEEWSSCPSACLHESCEDIGKKPVTCNTLVLNCEPRCVCCNNYYRNGTDICVSPDECECK